MSAKAPFHEGHLLTTPIRDLGLTITGTPMELVLNEFSQELEHAGIVRLKPHFYLSTEWGVPVETVSIAIPFYLARQDVTDVHAKHVGHLEGAGRSELLRYLRHEMGHVVNYAYKLYDQEEWIEQFGSMTQPYVEEYRPEPFSPRFVRHLPGWYAQKHPDEDWAETFAVWMTPNSDWRAAYAHAPHALAKLEYCDRTMTILNQREPDISAHESDEDVSEMTDSLEEYYRDSASVGEETLPPGLDGALQAIFEDYRQSSDSRKPAADLVARVERDLVANVYRWTGHFPESTRHLLHYLQKRAIDQKLCYPEKLESEVVIALTTLVTSLAMNHVFRGSYVP